jgi:hypothetical protein
MTALARGGAGSRIGLSRRLLLLVKAYTNVHRQGPLPNVFLFATPRSGSTWLMEIIASQPGFKYYDEPLNPRRENVAFGRLFPDYASLMPGTGDPHRIIGYLKALQDGRHRYMNPPPFRRNHRFFTNRIIFKIHEIEHLMDQVASECGGQLVYLLRHPIANSISRTVQPRLELFLNSPYYAALVGEPERSLEIRSIAETGTPLQRAVISWCYENLTTLRSPDPSRLVVTYEELVINPVRSCDLLMQRLDLPNRESMLAAFDRPAINIRMSHAQTLAAMNSPDAEKRRIRLVSKWMERTSESQYDEVAHVLSLFALDAYDARYPLAAKKFRFFDDTARLLQPAK